MTLKDFIVTPLLFVLILGIAYLLRRYVTNPEDRKYFMPALFFRMVCAIMVGMLYQFYYGGGDTFYYHTKGSAILAEALINDPIVGIKLFFSDDTSIQGAYNYYSRMPFFGVEKVFLMIRIGAIFDLFTYRTYSGTALLFALTSFTSAWFLFKVLSNEYPGVRRQLALGILFIPSVLIWGSGIFRDTIMLSAVFFIVGIVFRYLHTRKLGVGYALLILGCIYLVYSTKVYVITGLIPFFGVLLLFTFLRQFPSVPVRVMLFIPTISIMIALTYGVLVFGIQEESQYSLKNVAETARTTAYDIGFYTGKDAGSGYTLGEMDGTFLGLIRMAPAGVNVALFRPYLWEVRNPLMLLSALEAFAFLFITIYYIWKSGGRILVSLFTSRIACAFMFFALTIAFAVGVSTYNFGTLSRYKILALPFFFCALVLAMESYKIKKETNVLEAD